MTTLWWWFSYTDPSQSEGNRFLGGTLINGETLGDAIQRSHELGISPGGFLRFAGPFTDTEIPDEQPREVLLTLSDLDDTGVTPQLWDTPATNPSEQGDEA